MTISRKEFERYQQMIFDLHDFCIELRDARFWQRNRKRKIAEQVDNLCVLFSIELKNRVSKPRKKPEPTP